MGQTGNRGWGIRRGKQLAERPGRPTLAWTAGTKRGRQLARGRRECSSAPQPRAQQRLRAGVRQPPARATRGQCAFPRDLATRPPFASLHPPQPAPCTLPVGAQPPGSSIYCLFVVYCGPRARAWQRPGGGGTYGGRSQNFLPRERGRGILNRTPDAESSDQPSSDYSPLAPLAPPRPPPDLHKKRPRKLWPGPSCGSFCSPRSEPTWSCARAFSAEPSAEPRPRSPPARPASRR